MSDTEVIYLGVGIMVAWIALIVYAVRHRHEPFWHSFLDPFGFGPPWEPRADGVNQDEGT